MTPILLLIEVCNLICIAFYFAGESSGNCLLDPVSASFSTSKGGGTGGQ